MRPPSVFLLENLLVGQEKALHYFEEGISFLTEKLPELMRCDVEPALQNLQPSKEVISSEIVKLKEGYRKIGTLKSLEQSKEQYESVCQPLVQDFKVLQNTMNDLEGKLDKNSVTYAFFKFLFQNQQYKSIIQFYLRFMARTSNLILDDESAIQENLSIITDMEECMTSNIEYAETVVKSYLVIYSLDDENEAECFKSSISKEISFDPNLKEEYEDKCENKILRGILNNEAESSPNSFSDEECKVLDFMELATFHVDTTSKIAYLIRTIVATTTAKIDYLKYQSHQIDLNNLATYKNVFLNFEERMEHFASQLISKGTIGLSQPSQASTLISFLNEFERILKPVILIIKQVSVNIGRSIPSKKEFIKEEAHFSEALNSYLNSLTKLNRFIGSRSIALIIDTDKIEFENLDSQLKNNFFELIYFNQRLSYELDIMKHLQHREQ